MYHRLKNYLRSRLVVELRERLADHPRFKDVSIIVKFADVERPKTCIIIKNASSDPVLLAPDQFLGYNYSHAFLARATDENGNVFPGRAIEWIVEDSAAIKSGELAASGFYYIVITESKQTPEGEYVSEFVVEPLYYIRKEVLIENATGFEKILKLAHFPIQIDPDSLEVFDATHVPRIKLAKNIHYTYENLTGEITFTDYIYKGARVEVSYRYPGDTIGPVNVTPLSANNSVIPGIILNFSEYLLKGDRNVVAVTPSREMASAIFGGRWQVSLNMGILAMDLIECEKLSDYVSSLLWLLIRDKFGAEGIVIESVAETGEAENLEDTTAQQYNFESGLDIVLSSDWEYHVPLIKYVKNVSIYFPHSAPELTDAEVAALNNVSLIPVVELPDLSRPYDCERII